MAGQYQQPFLQYNVQCLSGHIHWTNYPVAGFVLVRLNQNLEVELLLDYRSSAVSQPHRWALIGGTASTIDEDPIVTASREAQEEYGILPEELTVLGLQYKHDHGGQYITYTYIWAAYNPKDGKPPIAKSAECRRSEFFRYDKLPADVVEFLREDEQFLRHTIETEVRPMLLAALGGTTFTVPDYSTGDSSDASDSVSSDHSFHTPQEHSHHNTPQPSQFVQPALHHPPHNALPSNNAGETASLGPAVSHPVKPLGDQHVAPVPGDVVYPTLPVASEPAGDYYPPLPGRYPSAEPASVVDPNLPAVNNHAAPSIGQHGNPAVEAKRPGLSRYKPPRASGVKKSSSSSKGTICKKAPNSVMGNPGPIPPDSTNPLAGTGPVDLNSQNPFSGFEFS
ncbi:hypothetical protein F5Y19DRAFT_117148 [Xylariaceae sp. FL1651]|nr:hypothetical protein F5Y19DRAFT_117148 [Xylariaceae sp. FL1651]